MLLLLIDAHEMVTSELTAEADLLLSAKDASDKKMNRRSNPSRLHLVLPNILKASEVLNATVLTWGRKDLNGRS